MNVQSKKALTPVNSNHQLIKIHHRVELALVRRLRDGCACLFPHPDNVMMSEKPIHNINPQRGSKFPKNPANHFTNLVEGSVGILSTNYDVNRQNCLPSLFHKTHRNPITSASNTAPSAAWFMAIKDCFTRPRYTIMVLA